MNYYNIKNQLPSSTNRLTTFHIFSTIGRLGQSRSICVITATCVGATALITILYKKFIHHPKDISTESTHRISPVSVPDKPLDTIAEPFTTAMQKAQNAGAKVLIHKTDDDSIIEILKAGHLSPPPKHPHVKRPVYLQLLNETQVWLDHTQAYNSQCRWPQICLVFSLELLKRQDYHISVGWNHGRFESGYSFKPTEIEQFFDAEKKLLDETDDPYQANEMVVESEVSLKYLRKIVVHPHVSKKLRKQVATIQAPRGLPSWNDLIIESEGPIILD